MGLKALTLKQELVPDEGVEIRPRWDWKLTCGYGGYDSTYVEIRPRWDWKWKSSLVSVLFSAMLKSDQDGIGRALTYRMTRKRTNTLKSDQDGIGRLRLRDNQLWRWRLLKSDQDGIGRFFCVSVFLRSRGVEIRPRWDWKAVIYKTTLCLTVSWNQTKMGLEDDWLSRLRTAWNLVEIRPRWDWKHIYYHGQHHKRAVEIRPRWDWKVGYKLAKIQYVLCWNQTKMGLEACSPTLQILHGKIVEIRPRWDWKTFWTILTVFR